jgi:hypothetical protein
VQALSLCTNPAAVGILERLRSQDPPVLRRAYLDEAISTNQRVRTLGLREFMRQSRGEQGGK